MLPLPSLSHRLLIRKVCAGIRGSGAQRGQGAEQTTEVGPSAPALFLPVGLTMAFLQNRPTLPLASAFPGPTVSDPAMKTLSRALSLT